MMSFIYYLLYQAETANGQLHQDGVVLECEEKIVSDTQIQNIRNQLEEYLQSKNVLIQSLTLLDIQKDKISTSGTTPSTRSYYISFKGFGNADTSDLDSNPDKFVEDGVVIDSDEKIASEQQIAEIQAEIAENFQVKKVVLTAINFLHEQKHLTEVINPEDPEHKLLMKL